jgi:mRNA interferase MazF
MARVSQLIRSATRSSSVEPYCPDAGDIITIELDPQAGREQAGRRPALVLSPKKYNQIARLCICSAMTNQAKGYPFEVPVPNDVAMGGGVVLADQVKCLDWMARKAEFRARAPAEVVSEVLAKLRTLLPDP